MKLSQVQIVQLRLGAGMSAFLTDVRLGTSLFVGELQFDAVNFACVRLERVVSIFYHHLLLLFPHLISAVADWMSPILAHMVWP